MKCITKQNYVFKSIGLKGKTLENSKCLSWLGWDPGNKIANFENKNIGDIDIW